MTATLILTCISAAGDAGAWTPLFDGKTLDGWVQRNGTATYRVEDGCVVGRTAEGSPNSFLCTERDYADFELEFEVKVDDRLNSGVQIRSASLPTFGDGRVHGPQVEIAAAGGSGYVYGEGKVNAWLSTERDEGKSRKAFKKGEWNKYRVRCDGPGITTVVNGVVIEDGLKVPEPLSGFIGLQVHSFGGSPPAEVRWRNIRVRELNKD